MSVLTKDGRRRLAEEIPSFGWMMIDIILAECSMLLGGGSAALWLFCATGWHAWLSGAMAVCFVGLGVWLNFCVARLAHDSWKIARAATAT